MALDIVADFSASPSATGLHNRLAIQAALDAVKSQGGCKLTAPKGLFRLDGPVIYENANNLELIGEGHGCTRFVAEDPNEDTLILSNVIHGAVADIGFDGTTPRTGGSGLRITNGCNDISVRRVLTHLQKTGFVIEGSVLVSATECKHITLQGIGTIIDGGNDHYLDYVFANGYGHEAGVEIRNSNATWLRRCGNLGAAVAGLKIVTSGVVEHLFMSENAWDSGSGHGILFHAHAGGVIRRVKSESDWASTNAQHGVAVAGPGTIQGLGFSGMSVFNNGQHGFAFLGNGHDVRVAESEIGGNSTSANGSYHGIYATGGMNGHRYIGNRSGGFAGFPASQGWGIAVDPSLNWVCVDDNDLRDNMTGALSVNAANPTYKIGLNLGA